MKNKKIILMVTLILIVVIGVFILGSSINKQKNQQQEAVIESIFQAPPEVISTISGVVKDLRGATIYLEIDDPEDYLPTDEVTKLIKYITVSDETEIINLSFNNTGDLEKTEVEFESIETGDKLSVTTNSNIRSKDKFSATSIEIINY